MSKRKGIIAIVVGLLISCIVIYKLTMLILGILLGASFLMLFQQPLSGLNVNGFVLEGLFIFGGALFSFIALLFGASELSEQKPMSQPTINKTNSSGSMRYTEQSNKHYY